MDRCRIYTFRVAEIAQNPRFVRIGLEERRTSKNKSKARTQDTEGKRPWAKKNPHAVSPLEPKNFSFLLILLTCHASAPAMAKAGWQRSVQDSAHPLSLSSRILTHPDSKIPPELTNYNRSIQVTPIVVPIATNNRISCWNKIGFDIKTTAPLQIRWKLHRLSSSQL